jgi:hypothetical protein
LTVHNPVDSAKSALQAGPIAQSLRRYFRIEIKAQPCVIKPSLNVPGARREQPLVIAGQGAGRQLQRLQGPAARLS